MPSELERVPGLYLQRWPAVRWWCRWLAHCLPSYTQLFYWENYNTCTANYNTANFTLILLQPDRQKEMFLITVWIWKQLRMRYSVFWRVIFWKIKYYLYCEKSSSPRILFCYSFNYDIWLYCSKGVNAPLNLNRVWM